MVFGRYPLNRELLADLHVDFLGIANASLASKLFHFQVFLSNSFTAYKEAKCAAKVLQGW